MRITCLVLIFFPAISVFSQSKSFSDEPKKGSYLYYGQPAFEDNSFLIEEAINQEKGILQHISNFYYDNLNGGNFVYSFTQEIPITHLRHQLNYTLYYNVFNPKINGSIGGFGDINIGYHYMLSGKKSKLMVVPSINLILPTGNVQVGSGSGGFGGQFSLAITKRLSHKLITNLNLGTTFVSRANRYEPDRDGALFNYEKDLQNNTLGASIIWYQTRNFNWLVEYVLNLAQEIRSDGSVGNKQFSILNPGFRFAIDHPIMQIVPGLSAPINFNNGKFESVGIFVYLSFEPEYLPFSKPKTR